MVVDEAHVGIGPEMFSKCSLFVNSQRCYGLTATPKRFDGNEDLIEYHLGNVRYIEPEEDELIKPLVYVVKFPFGIYEGKTIKYLEWGKNFSYARYYNQAEKSKSYIETVCKFINKAYSDGRTILVLGYRIDTLVEIGLKCNLPKEAIGLFVPGSTSKQRLLISDTDELDKAFKEKRIVLSTYGACRDGNNRKELDFLIMTMPTSNIEQAIGRIQRAMPGKKQPIVIDYVDTQGPKVKNYSTGTETTRFLLQSEKRKEIYRDKEWEFKEIELRV
jgi:superfamily II DNA or RNA helicase